MELLSAEETYGLVAFVAALIAQSFLVRVRKPTMPWQKVASKMYVQCLLNMCDNKIVVLGRKHQIACPLL
jgi:hypothetical protein